MNDFPLTFQTVHQGVETARVVNNREELVALRSELELLTLSTAGQARLACVALSNATSFESADGNVELHELFVDALHPHVKKTARAIDQDFPDVINEVCRDVLQDEAESFQTDVIACLSKSTSKKFQELSKTYALSVGLDPPDLQEAPSNEEASATLDESETTMNENANVPDPTEEEQADVVDNPTGNLDNVEVDAASTVAEETSGDGLAAFDNVEDALNAMESDLEELQALAGEEGLAETEDPSEPTSDVEAVEESVGESVETDATESDEMDDVQATLDKTFEASQAAVEELGDSTEPEVEFEPPAVLDVTPVETPVEAPAEAPTASSEEPIVNAESTGALEGLAEEMSANPVAAGILASFGAGSPTTEAPKKPTAEELRAELDEALIEDPVITFDESVSGPKGGRPSEQGFAERSNSRRPSRSPQFRRSASNHQSRSAESAIENFAGFLVDEVNSMWAEAREGLEEICAVRDEIESIRNEIRRTHQETIGMRDAAYAARKEARALQSQIQNQRDDANRARQRADAAAVDAQAACDRAAAAAREAESMATMSQPM